MPKICEFSGAGLIVCERGVTSVSAVISAVGSERINWSSSGCRFMGFARLPIGGCCGA